MQSGVRMLALSVLWMCLLQPSTASDVNSAPSQWAKGVTYASLPNMHIEPGCSAAEYKGSLGIKANAAECLAALKGHPDRNYAVS